MRPVRFTKTLAAASVNNIAQSQTPGAGALFTLNGSAVTGGVAILDSARRVLLTFAGNETGHNFIVTGNQRITGQGNTITETVAGTNGTSAYTNQDFGQITSITSVSAATGNIQVGTNGVASTHWTQTDYHLDPTNLTISVTVTGTVNYTIQYTYDDIMGSYDPQGGAWSNASLASLNIFNDPVVAAVTTSQEVGVDNPINAWRVLINSGTGTLNIESIQSGVGGLGS